MMDGMHSGNNNTLVLEIYAKKINFIVVLFFLIVSLFYVSWAVYLLREIFICKRKLRNLNHRCRSNETDELNYKYTGEYYKYILMYLIVVMEPLTILPVVVSTVLEDMNLSPYEVNQFFQVPSSLNTLAQVFLYVSLVLINTLTLHMTHFYRLEFRDGQFTPIRRKCLFLAFVLLVLLIIRLAIVDVGNLLVRSICMATASFEYILLLKNSRTLYRLLKWRYQDVLYEGNRPLYASLRRMCLRYKYITTYILACLGVIVLLSWGNIFDDFLCYKYFCIPSPDHGIVLLSLYRVFEVVDVLSFIAFFFFFSFIAFFTLYCLLIACWNRLGPMLGRRRVHFSIREPLLQP